MARQLSTSGSDLVLAASVAYVVYMLLFSNMYASIGLLIQGAAASAGVVKFAMSRAGAKIQDTHKMLTWLAITVGLPLLAVGFAYAYSYTNWGNFNLLFSLAVVASARFLPTDKQKLLTEAVSGFAIVSILLLCLLHINVYGLLATGLYFASGKVIGSEGYYHGIPRVDLMHIALALGNLLFMQALL